MPALTFAGGSNRVESTNVAAASNGTVCLWGYQTQNSQDQWAFQHSGSDESLIFDYVGGTGQIQAFRQRATVYVEARALPANFPAWPGLNRWFFLAWTWDLAAAGNCQLAIGTLAQAPMPPSSYDVQTNGSGTADTTTGTFRTGNNVGIAAAFVGSIAWIGRWPYTMTLGQLQRTWAATLGRRREVLPGGGTLNIAFGAKSGTGIQYDRSPYGYHGTITGATFARAPELDPYFRRQIDLTVRDAQSVAPALRRAKPWESMIRPAPFRPGLAR